MVVFLCLCFFCVVIDLFGKIVFIVFSLFIWWGVCVDRNVFVRSWFFILFLEFFVFLVIYNESGVFWVLSGSRMDGFSEREVVVGRFIL